MTTVLASYTNGSPIVPIVIGVSQPRVYQLANAGRTPPAPITCRLLIDTGADDTYVDLSVLQNLQLLPTNTVPVQVGASNSPPIAYDVYDARVEIQSTVLGRGHFALVSADVIAGDFSARFYDGLLGRDLLRYCVAHLDGKTQKLRLVF